MAESAPSSSFFPIPNPLTNHVFLNFCGEDTRYVFTNNLHQALLRKGIRSFMDRDNIEPGEEIPRALIKAIEQSMIAIVVFSENYAHSTSCLEELVKIRDCIKGEGRLVLPIFYKVEPSDVKHQTGSYELAFDKDMIEKRFGSSSEKLHNWRLALREAANLKGETYNEKQYEYDFIGRIVEQVSGKINVEALPTSVNCPVALESREPKEQFDSIADINSDKQTWKLAVRVMSLWEVTESQRLNMTLYDAKYGKIQASMGTKFLPRFTSLLKERECYVMENFEVVENKTKSYSQHKFLLFFQQTTIVEHRPTLNIPGWNWVPLQNVLDGQIADGSFIDVFGEVVHCAETYEEKLEFDLQDDSKGRISCTVWGKFAEQLSSAYKTNPRSPLIIAWHHAKINLFKGELCLNNAFDSSKLFINPDMDGMEEVIRFMRRRNYMELSSLETSSQLSSQQTFSSKNEWLSFGQTKTISEIKDTKQVSQCITMATIKMIETGSCWFYPACKTCNKKIDIESGKATYNCYCERPIICVPKYKIQVQVEDHTQARASFTLFDRVAVKLINFPVANLIKNIIEEKLSDNHFPDRLNVILGKQLLFKVEISQDNLERKFSTFTVMNITDDEQIIKSYLRNSKSAQNSAALEPINNEAQFSKNVFTAENVRDTPMKRQLLESEGDDDENIPPQLTSAKKNKYN